MRNRGHLLSFPLVRACGNYYEIVSGHRRCEAARRAGLERIPVEITNLGPWDATVRFLDEHVPTSCDEADAAVTDPYSGFYDQSQLEALLNALREDWSPAQLREHTALAWYLDTDDVYPDDQSEPAETTDTEDSHDETTTTATTAESDSETE